MAEFRVCYEKQDAEFVKRKIELGIPVILPSELKESLEDLGIVLPNEKDKKKNKKKKDEVATKESVSPSSVLMIAVAVAMAALTGNN